MSDTVKAILSFEARLSIKVFGVFSYAGSSSQSEHLKSRKAEALLLCLALCGKVGFEREQLSRMLWPDSADDRAKAGLRQALARIRRIFGEVFIAPKSGWIALCQSAVTCDLWDIWAACANPHAEPDSWPSDPYLVNYPVPSDVFSDWIEHASASHRQKLKRELLHALSEPDHGIQKLLGVAQVLLLVDPMDEESVAGVLKLLRSSNRKTHFIAVLETYKSRLKLNYDLEPSAQFLSTFDGTASLPAKPAPLEVATELEAHARHGKPVVSVNPFEVLSDDEELKFLSIAIAEEILAQLTSQDWFTVTTPESSPLYRLPQVGHHKPHLIFNSYVISGTILRTEDGTQVSMKLVDEGSSSVAWSKTFKTLESDTFSLRGGLAASLSELLTSKVIAKESSKAFNIKVDGRGDLWIKTMQARYLFWRMSRKNNSKARKLIDEVCADSDTPTVPAFVTAVFTRLLDVWSVWSKSLETDLSEAIELAERAVRIHPDDPWTHFALGTALGVSGQLDTAIPTLDRALAINPNFAAALGTKGKYQMFDGDLASARINLGAAIRLNELDTHLGLWQNATGMLLFLGQDFENALKMSNRAISTNRYWAHNYFLSAVCHWHLGELNQARKYYTIAIDSLAQPTRSELTYSFPFRDQALSDIWFEPLTELGLPP